MRSKAMMVASMFIQLANREELVQNGLTNLKLQKLLYFAQIHSLQKTGRPLFDDEVVAYDHGPVVPAVYGQYAGRRGVIRNVRRGFENADIPAGMRDLVQDVFDSYGRLSDKSLEFLSHLGGTPWQRVWDGSHHSPKTITESSMAAWASSNPDQLDLENVPMDGFKRGELEAEAGQVESFDSVEDFFKSLRDEG